MVVHLFVFHRLFVALRWNRIDLAIQWLKGEIEGMFTLRYTSLSCDAPFVIYTHLLPILLDFFCCFFGFPFPNGSK